MAYEAKIILDSIGPSGARLTTFELTYPRFVHAELMTHRVFSRNSASSRAIPTEKLLERIKGDPVLPVWWGRNQPGMQAREEIAPVDRIAAEGLWIAARNESVAYALALGRMGLHKQIANRVMEPWMFITVVVTATEWDNFWALRDHPDAQPELAEVAAKAHKVYAENTPVHVDAGDWHLPYVTGFDMHEIGPVFLDDRDLRLISVGRCAAVSYLHQDKRDPEADIARAKKILAAGHMSPFEHVAQAMTRNEWGQSAMAASILWAFDRIPPGNLWGWRQYRKMLKSEHDFSQIEKLEKIEKKTETP